jgi:hypothetical protein
MPSEVESLVDEVYDAIYTRNARREPTTLLSENFGMVVLAAALLKLRKKCDCPEVVRKAVDELTKPGPLEIARFYEETKPGT